MGSLDDKPLSGIGIPDSTFTWAARDTSTMSFTEEGPRPGSPIASSASAQAQPSVSGGQDTDIDVYVARAGMPHISHLGDRGMTVIWRESGGTWMGWNNPSVLHMQDCITPWGSVADYSMHDCQTIPSSQKVVAVYGWYAASTEPSSRILDPADWTWDAAVDIHANVPGDVYDDIAVCVLPSERILFLSLKNDGTTNQWRVYYSDDEAVTWTLASAAPFPGFTGATMGSLAIDAMASSRSRMVADRDGDVLYLREYNTGAADEAIQYASSSQGMVFERIGSAWTVQPPTHINLLRLRSGRLALVAEINGAVVIRRVSSPFESLEDASSTQILGSSADAVSAWVDADGIVYVTIWQNAKLIVYYSNDEGDSWADMSGYPLNGYPVYTADASSKILPVSAAATMGRAVLLGNGVDGGGAVTYDGMVWALHLGGWGDVEWPGWFDTANANGVTWLPTELPTTLAPWTQSTSGGTIALTTPGMMRVDTTAQWYYWYQSTEASFTDNVALIDIDVQSGGDITAADISVTMRTGDGANSREVYISFSATQFAVRDATGGGLLGSAVTHGVSGRLQVLMYVHGSDYTVSVWYKSATAETWTQSHDAVAIPNDAGAVTGRIIWGHITSTTGQSDWYQMHFTWSTDLGSLEPRDAQTELIGKALDVAPYPLPGVGPDSSVAFLSMLSGPGIIGESFSIDAQADYPISNIFHDVSPSPRAIWRATGVGSAVIAAWDAGQGTQPGESMFLAGLNCKCESLILEGFRAAAWETIATLDFSVGFSGIDYVLEGDVLRADTAGASGGRFIQRNELAGGWVDLDNGTDIREIRRNTSGEWIAEADASSVKARIYLDGVDGTETANATCTIYAPNGVVVVHDVKKDFTKFRVKINPGNALWGAWEAGAVVVGGIAVFGRRPDWGWTWRRDPNSSTRTDRGGTSYTTQEGSAPRTLSVSWQGGLELSPMRSSTSLDFRKATAGDPLAVVDDVPTMMLGLIEEIRSGETPVIALPYIPDTDTSITDPTLWLYARITSSAQIDHVVGDENSAELYRVSSLTFEEIV